MTSSLQHPIIRKVITGITGIGLTLFVIMHMVGNLQFFSPDPNAYNRYTYALESLGPLLYAVEIGLVAFFLFHAVVGIKIAIRRRKARDVQYEMYESAGGPSLMSVSSRSMIFTGVVLLVFVIVHVWTFKFGPGVAEGYIVTIDGVQMRDLKQLVVEKFQSPVYTFSYLAVMLLLASHLRHGVWSALQSLGLMTPRVTPIFYTAGLVLGLLLAAGFIVLPLYIYVTGGAP